MPGGYDVSYALVQISTDAGTTWTNIWGVTGWDSTHGTEDTTRRRILGSVTPVTRIGDTTDSYTLSGLLDLSDADGQNVLRDARDARTPVLVRFLPEGLGIGMQYKEQECLVSEYTDSLDAEGDFIECGFTLEGSGVLTYGTLAA